MTLLRRLIWWLRQRSKEAELREELQFHLEQEARERREAGLPDNEAAWAARRDLGNEAKLREDVRSLWTWRPLDELSQDVRYAWRTMRHHRTVSLFAVISLSLGIGANTAIYSFLDTVLLRSLPVADPDSLVVMTWRARPFSFAKGDSFVMGSIDGSTYRGADGGVEARIFPFPAVELLRTASAPVLSSLFTVFRAGRMNVLIDGDAELTEAQYVSGTFFTGLGLVPAAGRLLAADDDRDGAAPVAVLSAGYAQRRFGTAANGVGRQILVNNLPFTVAGVTPAVFDGVEPGLAQSLYLPLATNRLFDSEADGKFGNPNYYWAEIMGRLRPGVTLAQAQSALAAPFAQWVATTTRNDAERANLPVLHVADGGGGLDTLRRRYAKPLYLLQAIVALILAIACANVANLLLARATARQREIAVRLSIGAGRFRLIRQLLTESLVLSAIGGALGVVIAVGGTRVLSTLLANGDETLTLQAGVNRAVLMVTVGLSLICGLLFGLVPAWQSTKAALVPALKDAGTALAGRQHLPRLKLQQALVVAQTMLLLLLLVGAGLFTRTLANLQSIPLGFNPDHVLLFDLNAPQAGYPAANAASLYDDLRDRFAQLPGVRAATLGHSSLIRAGRAYPVMIDGRRIDGYRLMLSGPGFLSTMQIPLLAGREIDERDRAGAPGAAVVSELFARTHFPNQNPIGRRVRIEGKAGAFCCGNALDLEIVGIAAAAQYGPLKRDVPAVLYVPHAQLPPAVVGQVTYAIRTDGDPLRHAPAIRQIVRHADSRIPVTNFKTQTGEIASTINQEILLAQLCVAFAVLALVIACAGLYGTTAYTVACRTREIGIRMALGARRGQVVWMVVQDVCVLTMAALALTIPIASALSKPVESFLFRMQPNDPATITSAVAALLVAAMAASYAPARRASRIDPTTALRHE